MIEIGRISHFVTENEPLENMILKAFGPNSRSQNMFKFEESLISRTEHHFLNESPICLTVFEGLWSEPLRVVYMLF